MTDTNQDGGTDQQPRSKPFRGSEGTIRDLSSFPDSGSDRESLLDQIVDTPQESQPAQDKQGGNDDTK